MLKYKMVKTDDGKEAVAVNEKGLLILLDDDGKEVTLDALHLRTQVPALRQEAKTHREEKEALKAKATKLAAALSDLEVDVESDDSISDFFTKAKAAMEKVANLDDKQLLSIKEVETLKEKVAEGFNKQIKKITEAAAAREKELLEKIGTQDKTVYDLLVTNQFASSKFIKEKLSFPNARAAEKYFGSFFKVEAGPDGKLVPVGYHNGEKIFSTSKPGLPADFEEAVEYLVEQDPDKDSLLLGDGKTGTGAQQGNRNAGGGTLQNQLAEAQKSGNVVGAIALKRKMTAQQK